jgi:multiple sugar transport system substrate-binding protein
VQIAYSQTEGYVPVTSKAQDSEEYKDYLSRSGEDTDLHYFVKLDAAKLLLENTDNTFITPVFNGSTSLRNAAGDLIETTARSTRRKEKIDESYMENLYKDMISLYRLDRIDSEFNGKTHLGEMPTMSVVLISTLSAVWICIGIYAVINKKKKQRK